MVRRIISIDEVKCNGCGACAEACHEGAIGIVDGKAKLLRDDYCDGLGDCLPACPMAAITIIEREASGYDEIAVNEYKRKSSKNNKILSTSTHVLKPIGIEENDSIPVALISKSHLTQWPCQIKLVQPNARFLNNANLLVAADCTAFAYAAIHEDFMKGNVTLIGCPKLDGVDYSIRLTEILKNNDIKSITVLRMEVPCCGGLEFAVKNALNDSGKTVPWQVVVVTTDGKIVPNKD